MSIDLSLARIQKLFALLPRYRRPTIHVAGTNGKGSVTALLSSIFVSSHISVGRFNSPHLLYVWDSICVNGHPISLQAYRSVRTEVEDLNKKENIGATGFEVLTATAVQIFERAGVEIAIFEVGLGGRLDATNVLPDDVIVASAITSVDMDHQHLLGTTPAAIAREKAGIARKGKAVVLGRQKHGEVDYAVENVVQSVDAKLVRALPVHPRERKAEDLGADQLLRNYQAVTAHFEPWETKLDLELPLLGKHQMHNLETALTTLGVVMKASAGTPLQPVLDRISPSTIYSGVVDARWPGRLERVYVDDPPVEVLVDGAHNPASAEALQDYLNTITPVHRTGLLRTHYMREPRVLILGFSHSPGKLPGETLKNLLVPGDKIAFVEFSEVEDMPWVCNMSMEEMEQVGRKLVGEEGEVKTFKREVGQGAPMRKALEWAKEKMGNREEIVLAGSLYLVADFFRYVQKET